MPAPRVEIPNLDDLLQRYAAGESASDLAAEIGVSDNVIRKRIREAGMTVRPRTSYPTNMAPAHDARRGQRATIDQLVRRAAALHGSTIGASPHEFALGRMLTERGVAYVPQRQVGIYNLDLALEVSRVAVEVRGGGYTAASRRRWPERVEHILDEGWHLVDVRTGRIGLTETLADNLVAYADRVGRDPSAAREHRVVRGDGQPIRAYRENDHGPGVRRPVRGLD